MSAEDEDALNITSSRGAGDEGEEGRIVCSIALLDEFKGCGEIGQHL